MSKRNLLATFVAEEIKETFNIYGNYEIESDNTTWDYFNDEDKPKLIGYKYPEFDSLTATILKDGVTERYEPTGTTWAGRKYTEEDMICSFIAALIQGDVSYTKVFLDDGLQKFVDEYLADDAIATTVDDKKIPKRILTCSMFYMYQLMLVTNEFIYYGYEDMLLMLSTDKHGVVSDNYFAEVGLWDSVENIKSGKEKLLWGKLPEEN